MADKDKDKKPVTNGIVTKSDGSKVMLCGAREVPIKVIPVAKTEPEKVSNS